MEQKLYEIMNEVYEKILELRYQLLKKGLLLNLDKEIEIWHKLLNKISRLCDWISINRIKMLL